MAATVMGGRGSAGHARAAARHTPAGRAGGTGTGGIAPATEEEPPPTAPAPTPKPEPTPEPAVALEPARSAADHARALLNCQTAEEAQGYTATLRGKDIDAIAEELGLSVARGRVADRQHELAQSAIGFAFDHGAILHEGDPDKQDAFVDRIRQRRLARLDAPTEQPAPPTMPPPAAPSKVSGSYTDVPLLENGWGTDTGGGPGTVYVHGDGEIPWAVRRMGKDARLDVDGQPLGNVLNTLATDTVMGRVSAQEQVDRLKSLRDRLPEGSKAAQELGSAIRALDAPATPAPAVPAVSPIPLQKLVQDLSKVPAVRRDPHKEMQPLQQILADFEAGKVGSRGLISAVHDLSNRRHESKEGKFEIDAAVTRATDMLHEMSKHDRKSLYPPGSGGPSTPATPPLTDEQVAVRKRMTFLRESMNETPARRHRFADELARLEKLHGMDGKGATP